MQDIIKAIQIEQQYITDRENGKDYSLLKLIQEQGFLDLEQFFFKKRQYQIDHLNLKEYFSKVDTCLDVLFDLVKKEEPSVLIVPSDKVFVYHGDEPYDKEYCQKNNIPVYEVGHHGGTIVGGPEDISVGIILPKYIDVDGNWYLEEYKQIFLDNDIDVKIDNNDLIWQNQKIMGSAILSFEKVNLHVANFSFSDTSAYIEKICQMPRIKQPGTLGAVIKRDKIQVGVEKWLKL